MDFHTTYKVLAAIIAVAGIGLVFHTAGILSAGAVALWFIGWGWLWIYIDKRLERDDE